MRTRNIIIMINLFLVLGFINWSAVEKEEILAKGKLVLLELAPVDPRSLMQGDYMRLNYAITRDIPASKIPKRGYCVIKPDARQVAQKVRFQKGKKPLNAGEYLINYTTDDWSVNLGAESYFFEEGQGKKFENAKYGAVKIDEGHSLLIGLYDENLKFIEP
jgi:uncharacterized membrane-anchored protein